MQSQQPSRKVSGARRLWPGWPLVALGFIALALMPAHAFASDTGAQIAYTKVLKGSVPEYEKIAVNTNGSGEYDGRSLNAPPNPQHFQLSAATSQRLFGLAAALKDFNGVKLESGKHVADLGLKTLQYDAGGQDYSCQFNYSTNRDAQELTDLLEGIGAVERHITALNSDLKYDLLGLPEELTLIQNDLDNSALTDPQIMAGTLEAIAHDPRVLHFAQVRARRILQEMSDGN
ncbi:MAG: hypothetical protein ACRD1O_05265 [Terriglobia bacterium]